MKKSERRESIKNVLFGSVYGSASACISYLFFGDTRWLVLPFIFAGLSLFALMRFRNGESF